MNAKGKYIYGIINSSALFSLSIPRDFLNGLSASANVYPFPFKDIAALVSDAYIVDYSGMQKDALARLLIGHQTVIEKIMPKQLAIIPMGLGTFAQDETEVRDILAKGYNLITGIFEKINAKMEIDIAVTLADLNTLIKETSKEKKISEFKEKLLANPKGITKDEQMKLGMMLAKALHERKEEFVQRIMERLADLSEDTRIHELMDENMVMNAAFLILKSKYQNFEKTVEELNIEFDDNLHFRCVGPLAPYSFYTLEIIKLNFEEIDWAKKRLGILNDQVSSDDLKKAYQSRAFSTHPDKKQGQAAAEFNEVNRAHRILTDYSTACEQTQRQGKIHLDREMFAKNAIWVKLRK
ncbi:MAG: GvpL/GvpF family gas vesicle protein [Chrysiogenales bacterium]